MKDDFKFIHNISNQYYYIYILKKCWKVKIATVKNIVSIRERRIILVEVDAWVNFEGI